MIHVGSSIIVRFREEYVPLYPPADGYAGRVNPQRYYYRSPTRGQGLNGHVGIVRDIEFGLYEVAFAGGRVCYLHSTEIEEVITYDYYASAEAESLKQSDTVGEITYKPCMGDVYRGCGTFTSNHDGICCDCKKRFEYNYAGYGLRPR